MRPYEGVFAWLCLHWALLRVFKPLADVTGVTCGLPARFPKVLFLFSSTVAIPHDFSSPPQVMNENLAHILPYERLKSSLLIEFNLMKIFLPRVFPKTFKNFAFPLNLVAVKSSSLPFLNQVTSGMSRVGFDRPQVNIEFAPDDNTEESEAVPGVALQNQGQRHQRPTVRCCDVMTQQHQTTQQLPKIDLFLATSRGAVM